MYTDSDFWKWIETNIKADPKALRLKYHNKSPGDFDIDAAIRQVECRQRFGKKLAGTLAANPHFLFPTELSGEQCTSDALASWHAGLIAAGSLMVDLTAGLGIDAIHCAKVCAKVVAVERNSLVAQTLSLNAPDIEVHCDDCRDFVKKYTGEKFDVAFIDPARRAADGSRLYDIADCEPDVLKMLPDIERIANRLMIKLSPMLDISRTLASLPSAHRITALGTPTECKELVVEIDFTSAKPFETIIHAATIGKNGFSFTQAEEARAKAAYVAPEASMWLYEPYPAVMKAGCYNLLCQHFDVQAVAPNTHIYLSSNPVTDFPGTEWKIVEVLPFASKHIKRLASRYPRIDVATRNFPMPAATLTQKLKVRQGTGFRLIALTSHSGAPLMIIVAGAGGVLM